MALPLSVEGSLEDRRSAVIGVGGAILAVHKAEGAARGGERWE